MPRYRFQICRGKFSNGSSVEATLEGAEAAWKEAVAISADLARDIVSAEPEWLLEVADEAGQAFQLPVCRRIVPTQRWGRNICRFAHERGSVAVTTCVSAHQPAPVSFRNQSPHA
ncbi:MAG TPA: hypothetical protein VK577_13925, partial [Bradyrhizobium sp.]|nr:hypothetical protein [Bradyrhizobium sp.]